jgi:hypothetical protein
MKSVKNCLKTQNPSKTKKIPELIYDFLGVFKLKKHIILTSLIIWNHLTQKNNRFGD